MKRCCKKIKNIFYDTSPEGEIRWFKCIANPDGSTFPYHVRLEYPIDINPAIFGWE